MAKVRYTYYIRLLFGKKLNFGHSEYYKTCARVRSIDEHVAPKIFELEHTKPIFNEYKFLTIHNLHKLFVLNELYKIQKYRSPISLHNYIHKMHDSVRQCRKNNLVVPHYKLNVSRNQFLYCSITTWNQINNRYFNLYEQSCMKSDMDFISDLSTSFSIVKKKFKGILLKLQSAGDTSSWEGHNFMI